MLNERLRVQEETGQHNNDLKEEREVARQELASEERLLVCAASKGPQRRGRRYTKRVSLRWADRARE